MGERSVTQTGGCMAELAVRMVSQHQFHPLSSNVLLTDWKHCVPLCSSLLLDENLKPKNACQGKISISLRRNVWILGFNNVTLHLHTPLGLNEKAQAHTHAHTLHPGHEQTSPSPPPSPRPSLRTSPWRMLPWRTAMMMRMRGISRG